MSTPSILDVRRSYWWASRYLESLYREVEIDGQVLGVIPEYHARFPLTQVVKKIGTTCQFIHPVGLGMFRALAECVPGVVDWFDFSRYHDVWDHVHNVTRDYSVIVRLGFEETEPAGYAINFHGITNPCGDIEAWQNFKSPIIRAEYTRNRLRNGSFEFFHYVFDQEGIRRVAPKFWNLARTPQLEHLFGLYEDETSYRGRYLLIESNEIWQDVPVLPGIEYVLSWYYRGNFPEKNLGVYVKYYDANNNYINCEVAWPPPSKEWKYYEIRFRPPMECSYVTVYFVVGSYATSIDEVWLSECPVNLNPYYRFTAQIDVNPYVAVPGVAVPGVEVSPDRLIDIYFNGQLIWEKISQSNVPLDVFEADIPLD